MIDAMRVAPIGAVLATSLASPRMACAQLDPTPIHLAVGFGVDTIASPAHEIFAEPHSEVNRGWVELDRKSTRLNSSHLVISYAVFCLKKKKACCMPLSVSVRP